MNELEFLQEMKLFLTSERVGLRFENVHIGVQPKQLGGVNWYYVSYEIIDMFARSWDQVSLINMRDEHLRRILITTRGDASQEADIWANFTAIEPQFYNKVGTTPTLPNVPNDILHGEWNSNVYSNAILGLKFIMPSHFYCFDSQTPENRNIVNVMGAYGILNDDFVAVELQVRSMPRGMRDFPILTYLQILTDSEVLVREDRAFDTRDISMSLTPKEIAGHQWYTSGLVFSPPDLNRCDFRIDTFVTVVGSHIWILKIETDNVYTSEDVVMMFSAIESGY